MKTVLVVDDAQTIRTAVAWTLRGPDFRVLEARSTAEAQSSLNRQPPDLILVDTQLEGEDGFAFCADVKRRPGLPIPVLLMSSALASMDQGRADSARADGHLKKPFDTQTLIDLVRTHLRLPLTDDTPLTYAGRLARQRALEGGTVASTAAPPPVPVDAPPPPFAPPPAEVDMALPIEDVEPIEISGSDVEIMSEEVTDEGATGGPSLEPPPPPSAPSRGAHVDVWALTDRDDGHRSPPPRMPPRTSRPPAAAPMVDAVAAAVAGPLAASAPVPGLDRETLERIARETIEAVAWEVVPDLAETIIREELARLMEERAKH